MSEEIAPIAWIKENGEFISDKKKKAATPGSMREALFSNFKTPLYAIPATHRIVPVELLERCSREFQSMEGTELAYPEHASAVQCHHELRAIIDKESE